jgi:ubiquinone/menaquinone biosynthesis C-methylase UbiE
MMGSVKDFSYIYDNIISKLIARLNADFFDGPALSGRTVLDAGCWWGWFIKYARGRGADVYGFDLEPSRINDGAAFAGKRGLCAADALKLPFKDAAFDLVFSWHVIEHVENADTMLSEFNRVIRSGGSLVIGTPNKYNLPTLPFLPLRRFLGYGQAGPESKLRRFLRSMAYTDIDHKEEQTRRSLNDKLISHGFEAFSHRYYGLDLPAAISYSFSRDQKAYIQYKTDRLVPPGLRSTIIIKAKRI